jgi:hypothetical protein
MLLRNGFKVWNGIAGIGSVPTAYARFGIICSNLSHMNVRMFASTSASSHVTCEEKSRVVPGLHLPRTRVTSELWKSRLQQIQNEALLDGAHSISPGQLLTKTPSESRREILVSDALGLVFLFSSQAFLLFWLHPSFFRVHLVHLFTLDFLASI